MKASTSALLEQIYYGNFLPSEHIQSQDPKYHPSIDEAEEENRHMRKLLNRDDMTHLEHLLDLNLDISCMESCASFVCGFRYGALLMLVILESKDSLRTCP